MRTVHLVCNAHIDPVWQWRWDEGAAAALATFRAAADFCEEYEGFVFNHNEAILYQWVEEYEPALFARIRALVAAGRWHIMGGWFLQPDCNLPSGESLVRQVAAGRRYFRDRFGVAPTTAMNVDPFGHTRGLVQILARCGYDSYLFWRPDPQWLSLPSDDFVWVGYDGSRVTAHRAPEGYNSLLGHAREKVERWLAGHPDTEVGLVLWGVGNHGGGPSRQDLDALGELIAGHDDRAIAHSTPERFFRDLRDRGVALPEHAGDLNPWAVGCYTSQALVKQRHRRLESELGVAEKMASAAAAQGLMAYPADLLAAAERDLLFAEFHDILPGSSVQGVEGDSLRLMDHGLEILARVAARAFFALAGGQPPARPDEIPVLVYNPHPFPVRHIVECEFMLPDQNWGEDWTVPRVRRDGAPLPSQVEHEESNISLDWRKRVAFRAELAPGQMNRFDCALERLARKPDPAKGWEGDALAIATPEIEVVVNRRTGLIDRYAVGGRAYLSADAFLPLVIADDDDSWGMLGRAFRTVAGRFSLMSPARAARFCGALEPEVAPVRVVEDGPVRTVVEAYLEYGDSALCQTYLVPKEGAELEVRTRVYWDEKGKMLKLSVPIPFAEARYVGQVAYGRDDLPSDGREAVAQAWTAVVSDREGAALTIINEGIYGSDCADGEVRLSLLRSPGYAAHPIPGRPIMPADRFAPRMDQGERAFRVWVAGGEAVARLDRVDREATIHNERPYALSLSPSGGGQRPGPFVELGDDVVQLTACRQARDGSGAYILRLFEPTGHPRRTTLRIPPLGLERDIALGAFEIKTLRVDTTRGALADDTLDA